MIIGWFENDLQQHGEMDDENDNDNDGNGDEEDEEDKKDGRKWVNQEDRDGVEGEVVELVEKAAILAFEMASVDI